MARIPGIQIEKDKKGNPAYARINLKKHGENLRPFLEQVGAVEEDEFEKLWGTGLTVEQARAEMHKHIDKLYNK